MPPRQRKPDTRPGDRHEQHPLTVRFPAAIRQRLEGFARRVGKGERAVVREAVTEYLDRHDPDTSTPKEQDR